jgi:hypothetical protein
LGYYIKQETSMKQAESCYLLVSYLNYSSILKMETACSSEASFDFKQTTRRYVPEDRTFRNLKPYTPFTLLP